MTALIHRLPFLGALLSASRRRTPQARPRGAEPVEADGAATLEERRGDAMRRLYPKLHHWRATTFDRSAALQAYTYLAEADSVDDLERRVHQVERRRHFRH